MFDASCMQQSQFSITLSESAHLPPSARLLRSRAPQDGAVKQAYPQQKAELIGSCAYGKIDLRPVMLNEILPARAAALLRVRRY